MEVFIFLQASCDISRVKSDLSCVSMREYERFQRMLCPDVQLPVSANFSGSTSGEEQVISIATHHLDKHDPVNRSGYDWYVIVV